MSAIAGVFARETGYGFAFTIARDPAASLASATAPPDTEGSTLERDLRRPLREGSRQAEGASVAPADHQVASGAARRRLRPFSVSRAFSPAPHGRQDIVQRKRRARVAGSRGSCGVRLEHRERPASGRAHPVPRWVVATTFAGRRRGHDVGHFLSCRCRRAATRSPSSRARSGELKCVANSLLEAPARVKSKPAPA
jgi:hypothetical protein